MAVELNDNIFIKAPKPTDSRSGVYSSLAEALESPKLISAYRSIGLSVFVNDGELVEYWFKDGIEDEDLVIKNKSDLFEPIDFTDAEGLVTINFTEEMVSKFPRPKTTAFMVYGDTETEINDYLMTINKTDGIITSITLDGIFGTGYIILTN